MKTQIRRGVFETNSSSTHGISITNHVAILTDKEYKDYQNDKLFITQYGEIMTLDEFNNEVTPIVNSARREWRMCADNKSPKCWYTERGIDEEGYVKEKVAKWKEAHLAHEDSDTELTWGSREINGESVHVLSIAKGEDYEYYDG